jgi:predicted PurR-regulated permease PerM
LEQTTEISPARDTSQAEPKDTVKASSNRALHRRARLRDVQSYAVIGLFVLAAGSALYVASELFLPIFLALFLCVILYPAVRTISAVGVPDWCGALLVVGGLVGATGLALFQLSDPAMYWLDELPEIVRKLEREFWGLRQSIEEASEATEKLKDMAGSGGGGGGDTVVIQGPSFLRQLANYTWLTMAQIVMTLGLLYMLLAQGRRAARSFIRRIDNRSAFVDFMGAVQERFSTYVRALTAINLCVGALTALAMLLLGMPNPVMWGLLAFFLNFLPFVGPLAMLAILTLAGLASFDTWLSVASVPAAFAVINAVECYAVTPVVLGRKMTLSPILIFISMLFWTWCWGMPGAFLAAPIAVFAKLVYDFLIGQPADLARSEAAAESK